MDQVAGGDAFVVKSYPHVAFERVKENHWCAGVDGICIEEFGKDIHARLNRLVRQLETRTYRP